ncbi:MAG: outer membrane protein [Gemmatimonadota bacterium]
MIRSRPIRLRRGVAVLFCAGAGLTLLLSGSVAAQSGEGYLFGRPGLQLDFFGGFAAPRAGGDAFADTFEDLILDEGDLRTGSFGGSLAFRVTERIDVAGELAFSRASEETEYRDWVGSDGLPIVQSTVLTRVPVSLVVRGYPWDRGRSVGRLAWVPRDWVPYAGAGVGVTWYEFVRRGEFVVETDPDRPIFEDHLIWDGYAPTAHLLAGLEASLTPRLLLRGEGRYSWASGDDRSRDFDEEFDAVDLAGFQAVIGLSVRFGGGP